MRLTAEETAWVIIVIVKRSKQTRARVSRATVLSVSGRVKLRSAFTTELGKELGELGWAFVELDTGGFGVMRASTLESAKAVTAKSWLEDVERRKLRRGEADVSAFMREALAGEQEPPDDED